MGALSTRSPVALRRHRERHAASRWKKNAPTRPSPRRHGMVVLCYDLGQMSDVLRKKVVSRLERRYGVPCEAFEPVGEVFVKRPRT